MQDMHAIYRQPSPGFFRLMFAKKFLDNTVKPQEGSTFAQTKGFSICQYTPTTLEKVGRVFQWGVAGFLDFFLRNFKNPLMIITLTAIAMVVTTFCFYPIVTFAGIVAVIPFLQYVITPTVLLAITFGIAQLTILGICLRTLGRLNNQGLMGRYNAGELKPILIGQKV
jgi:hypothetical protein